MRVKVKTLRCFEGDIKPTNIFRLRGLLGYWFRHERLEGRERLEGLPPFDEGGRVVLPDGILANTLDSTVCKVKPRSDTRDYRRQLGDAQGRARSDTRTDNNWARRSGPTARSMRPDRAIEGSDSR